MTNKICECCNQIIIETKSFDEAHKDSVVIWDNEAKDIAEEWLYAPENAPELCAWESLKLYKFLAADVKTQIKRFYEVN